MTPAKLQALKPWLLTGLGALVAAFYLFPVYWMVSSALKTSNEVNAAIPTLWPSDPTLAAFRWIFERENVGRYLYNSLIISVGTTALTLLLATGAAYALSRYKLPFSEVVNTIVTLPIIGGGPAHASVLGRPAHPARRGRAAHAGECRRGGRGRRIHRETSLLGSGNGVPPARLQPKGAAPSSHPARTVTDSGAKP